MSDTPTPDYSRHSDTCTCSHCHPDGDGNRSRRNRGTLVNGKTPFERRNGEHLDNKEIRETFAVLNGDITVAEYLS
jgi:hypothetical protein